jgi:hypothetical protein
MGNNLIHWLVVLTIVLVLFGGRKFRGLRNGPRGGPPTHPIPVTAPIETSRPSASTEKPWQVLIGFLRPGPPR